MRALDWSGRARDGARFVVSGSKVVARGTVGLVRMASGGGLADALRPWMTFGVVDEVPFDLIAHQGYRAVLFDLENTLVPPGGPFGDEARELLAKVRSAGLEPVVVTNASGSWVRRELDAEGVPFVAPAGKPGREGFLAGCRLAGVRASQAVMVGDQLITDVFGAQRAGIRAILLTPRWDREPLSAKFQRLVSRGVLRLTRR